MNSKRKRKRERGIQKLFGCPFSVHLAAGHNSNGVSNGDGDGSITHLSDINIRYKSTLNNHSI